MRTFILAACVFLLALTAYAGPIVPVNLIVDRGGLEWVWASPCAPEQPSCGNSIVDSAAMRSLMTVGDLLTTTSG